jgi:hypothetical protein
MRNADDGSPCVDNAAIIVEAVNSYDRLKRIEAAARRLKNATLSVSNLQHAGVAIDAELWGELWDAGTEMKAALDEKGGE